MLINTLESRSKHSFLQDEIKRVPCENTRHLVPVANRKGTGRSDARPGSGLARYARTSLGPDDHDRPAPNF